MCERFNDTTAPSRDTFHVSSVKYEAQHHSFNSEQSCSSGAVQPSAAEVSILWVAFHTLQRPQYLAPVAAE